MLRQFITAAQLFSQAETGSLFHLSTSADLLVFENISTNWDSVSDTILIYSCRESESYLSSLQVEALDPILCLSQWMI